MYFMLSIVPLYTMLTNAEHNAPRPIDELLPRKEEIETRLAATEGVDGLSEPASAFSTAFNAFEANQKGESQKQSLEKALEDLIFALQETVEIKSLMDERVIDGYKPKSKEPLLAEAMASRGFHTPPTAVAPDSVSEETPQEKYPRLLAEYNIINEELGRLEASSDSDANELFDAKAEVARQEKDIAELKRLVQIFKRGETLPRSDLGLLNALRYDDGPESQVNPAKLKSAFIKNELIERTGTISADDTGEIDTDSIPVYAKLLEAARVKLQACESKEARHEELRTMVPALYEKLMAVYAEAYPTSTPR